MNRETEKQLNR